MAVATVPGGRFVEKLSVRPPEGAEGKIFKPMMYAACGLEEWIGEIGAHSYGRAYEGREPRTTGMRVVNAGSGADNRVPEESRFPGNAQARAKLFLSLATASSLICPRAAKSTGRCAIEAVNQIRAQP